MLKQLIREKNLILRKNLNQKQTSKVIISKIISLKEFNCAKNILIFYPLKYEISLLDLTLIKDKNYYLPKVDGDNLLICPMREDTEFKKSSFGVLEPMSSPVSPSIIDIAFIPALAVDKNLNRVGYGKGFYDRLFSNPEFRAPKIVVINKEFTNDLIDTDPYDKKIDFVITD